MQDKMLGILYKKVFQTKAEAERLNTESGEHNDRLRQVAISNNKLLNELVAIRTDQLRNGDV